MRAGPLDGAEMKVSTASSRRIVSGQRAKKGIMITTSSFSSEARDYVSKIDKKIDTDYFTE